MNLDGDLLPRCLKDLFVRPTLGQVYMDARPGVIDALCVANRLDREASKPTL